jgi:hypothetical protein
MSGIAVQPLMPDLTDGDFGEGKGSGQLRQG